MYSTCLVVIARNEAARIERLLRSVAPFVDRMLVLDTGSTDATAALAAACGARVEHFTWIDDFSVARNRALDLAGADWHLVLDADEWLISGGEALSALRKLKPDFVASVELRDQFFDGELRQGQGRLSRVLPGSVRYAGSIHEQPQHQLPVRALDIVVGHDGYLPDRLEAKRGRNRQLLEKALAAAPDDAYLHYQLGKDADVYEDFAEAAAAFARAAALPGAEDQSWWPELMTRWLFALKKLKRHERAMPLAESQLARCADSPDFFFVLGDLLLDLAADEPARAEDLLPMIEQAWTRCLELGERPEQPGAVAGRGSFLAAHNLALVMEGTGRAELAAELRLAYPAPGHP
ncbi:glycosyltransferase [Pelomonas sp. SE-A7]|uniref:glycosyltransferase n=1 Tax=Pelomonas sp. SE-A7 TaxID=3054953 RepID=UPI00259C8B50|nr:glycosyltransferase [Pelomonas sp. SE-A7]MDM4764513.1 glycosyltransferase [Pelomonas sp. SE-A7]